MLLHRMAAFPECYWSFTMRGNLRPWCAAQSGRGPLRAQSMSFVPFVCVRPDLPMILIRSRKQNSARHTAPETDTLSQANPSPRHQKRVGSSRHISGLVGRSWCVAARRYVLGSAINCPGTSCNVFTHQQGHVSTTLTDPLAHVMSAGARNPFAVTDSVSPIPTGAEFISSRRCSLCS